MFLGLEMGCSGQERAGEAGIGMAGNLHLQMQGDLLAWREKSGWRGVSFVFFGKVSFV